MEDKINKIKKLFKTNKKYKNSVFVDLFYEDENAKENELSLYNALFGTNYTLDEVEVQKIRVEDSLYMNLQNDASFNVDNRILVFSEHQSTINDNMPLRKLLYSARIYEQLIPKEDRYRTEKVVIPRPEFFVFYNGTRKMPAEKILRLSDSYVKVDKNKELPLELVVRVININSNAGHELLEKCRVLKEYTQFVETVRRFDKAGYKDYMKRAVEYCTTNHILEEYLKRKGSDVMGFLCAEYDYETDMRVKGQEKYEEGIEKGIECFILDNLEERKSKEVVIAKLQKRFELSVDDSIKYFEKYSQNENKK